MRFRTSEVIALCKEVPVILVMNVEDKKIIFGRKGAEEDERHKGLLRSYIVLLRKFDQDATFG
jgi:hypothetical protein